MWDIHPMLKDWECMTDLLLEDPLNPEDGKYFIETFSSSRKKNNFIFYI